MRSQLTALFGPALLGLALFASVPACVSQDHAAHSSGAHEHAGHSHGELDAAFGRLAALQGDWYVKESNVGAKESLGSTWRVTGGGSAVVETLFPGQPHEMVTVYHRDGHDLVLTHYCAGGNQPRMRATNPRGDELVFEFEGGANIDPATTQHMHRGVLKFLGPNEIRAEWQGWADGKADPAHLAIFHLVRKPG
ncbi:MAG: hypothetical protein ACT4PU_06445 [Planctomycetota bacterium]